MAHQSRLTAFVFLMTLFAGSPGCRIPGSSGSDLDEVTVLGGDYANVGVRYTGKDSRTGYDVAEFFYLDGKARHTYAQMQDEPVLAVKQGDHTRLLYSGQVVGRVQGGKLYLCDDFTLPDGTPVSFDCNATFYNPDFQRDLVPEAERGSLHAGYHMDISLADPASTSEGTYQLTQARFTLENHAQNQISQYGTATCAYNAATGIMEILYSMNTGTRENFSEPFYLAYSPSFGQQTSWFWTMYERADKETRGMLRDSELPVTSIYRSGVSFSGAERQAQSTFAARGGNPVKFGFPMKGHKIFFHAEWRGGYMRSTGKATDQDFDAMINWFTTNKQPVNLHYWINGIWHSVIMMGYDPDSGNIMIKDSLGNTHLKGSWKSRSWFKNYTYAAIGVTGGTNVATNPPSTGGGDVTQPDDPPVTPPITPPVTPPTDDDPVQDNTDWAKRFKVAVKYGRYDGRYKSFWLSLSGTSTDLDKVVSVRYAVHRSFGRYANTTIDTRADSFETGKYLTFARGWRTGSTVVKIRVNGSTRDVTLPGILINW